MKRKYMLAREYTGEGLAATVESLLAEGWDLQGGVHVLTWPAIGEQGRIYMQAMIKEEGESE